MYLLNSSFLVKNYIKQKKSLFKISFLILLIVLITFGLYQWYKIYFSKPEEILRVQTVKATDKDKEIPDIIETIGNLTGQQEIKIKATGPSRVGKIWVESGNFVKAGTELITLIGGSEVRAPFDGYLCDWLVKQGDFVNSGNELIEFINTDVLSLSYRVPEQYAQQLELGQAVQIKVRSLPDTIFNGQVKFIAPQVDKKTCTILVRAEVNNLDQNLWPGMSAHVRHILNNATNAIVIPEAALILTLEGYEALVVEHGKLARRKVNVGNRMKGRATILTGLRSGESVLLTRTHRTVEGTSVIPEDWTGSW